MECVKPVNSLTHILLGRDIRDVNEQELLLEIGRTYFIFEYYDEGIAYMKKLLALKTFDRNVEALFLYALCEQAEENYENEINIYRRILEIQPNFVDARINLFLALHRLGRENEALIWTET
jgi:tetratricopeptide (TPR) repeat protein